MKKLLFGMLLFIAFGVSANAQENKESAKEQSCCATEQQTASAASNKCHADAASKSSDKSPSCSVKANAETESASTTQVNQPVASDGEKKACKSDGSCCGAKTAEKA